MTSGVYPRKPGAKLGRRAILCAVDVQDIRADHAKGKLVKWLSAYYRVSEKTIGRVLQGTGAYKDMT